VNIQTQKLANGPNFEGTFAQPDIQDEQPNCRANSRRGQTDPSNRSYQPVESVRRALMILRAFDSHKISTISSLFEVTGIPRPTIVRMLETLMFEGYVIRDNMCGGYRLTSEIASLTAGYSGISRVIELARPMAIDLTRQVKWPIGLGTIDGDAIEIQFWTGTISPWAYTNTTLGIRPDLLTTGMGRAYLAFCEPEELDRRIDGFRADPKLGFGAMQEHQLRMMLKKIRLDGYAMRDPQTPPYRISTVGIPLLENGKVQALISLSFFSSAVLRKEISEQIIQPLLETRSKIESALEFMSDGAHSNLTQEDGSAIEMSF
jgi:IclR family transcriptional regulator, mhp operon transcriptional activator